MEASTKLQKDLELEKVKLERVNRVKVAAAKRTPKINLSIDAKGHTASSCNIAMLRLLNEGVGGRDGEYTYGIVTYNMNTKVLSITPVEVKGIIDIINTTTRHLGLRKVVQRLKQEFRLNIPHSTTLIGKWNDYEGRVDIDLKEFSNQR